jgi:hypothetical protein
MLNDTPDDRLHPHHHAVQFYGTDQSLFVTVAGFLAEGLVAGQPAIVIATATHRIAILEHLCGRLIDCEKAIRNGDLVLLDAEATLDLFMVDDEPDGELFEQNVGRLVDQAINGRQRTILRAYGEMVDVLWKGGQTAAAIRLEMLWNQLAQTHAFSLLCGYSMGHFYKDASQSDIRRQHTHVISDSGEHITLH